MHTSIATDSSNHAILLKHLDVFYFQIIYSGFIYAHELEKTWYCLVLQSWRKFLHKKSNQKIICNYDI